jgi:hypothetical protein
VREAAIVIGHKALQHAVGRLQIEALFAGEAVRQDALEALDTALGLWQLSRDVRDTELLQGPAESCGFALTGKLFFDAPVIVVANENAVAGREELGGGFCRRCHPEDPKR